MWCQSVAMFIPGILRGGGNSPKNIWGIWGESPPKKKTYNPPPTAAKLCALNLFFGRYNELQIYHGNFLLMDSKHRKLFVIKQSKKVQICV